MKVLMSSLIDSAVVTVGATTMVGPASLWAETTARERDAPPRPPMVVRLFSERLSSIPEKTESQKNSSVILDVTLRAPRRQPQFPSQALV